MHKESSPLTLSHSASDIRLRVAKAEANNAENEVKKEMQKIE